MANQLNYWLETIRALAKDAPILIVATHTDQRDPDLPLKELQKEFSQIKGHFSISNSQGEGIQKLKNAIASHSVKLPMMGEVWPENWLTAANGIRDWSKKQNTCKQTEFLKKLQEHGLEDNEAEILTKWLHQLGDILYYRDEQFPELDKTVILNTEWLSKRISQVMANEEVIKGLGIFTRVTMDKVWAGETESTRNHLLSMLEKFDLSYKTLDDKDISLVVDRLNRESPPYESRWNKLEDASTVSMRFKLAMIPAGIPTWFIARSHRFATKLHWRTGALFTDDPIKDTHLALLQTNLNKNEIYLTVRGVEPMNFFSKLREGLELTLARFKGLDIQRFVPCPGHGKDHNEKCSLEFSYEYLLKALKKKRDQVECGEEIEPIPLTKLLFGLHVSSIKNLQVEIDYNRKEFLTGHQELLELTQRLFLNLYNREKDRDFGKCPYVFTLSPYCSTNLEDTLNREKMLLHLYCQAPKCWHSVEKGGVYTFDKSEDWLRKMAPYIGDLSNMMKTYLPLAILGNTAWGIPDPQIKIMQEALKAIPIGELRLHTTPEGHYYWLCPKHYEAMTKPHAGNP
jgi:internalin A